MTMERPFLARSAASSSSLTSISGFSHWQPPSYVANPGAAVVFLNRGKKTVAKKFWGDKIKFSKKVSGLFTTLFVLPSTGGYFFTEKCNDRREVLTGSRWPRFWRRLVRPTIVGNATIGGGKLPSENGSISEYKKKQGNKETRKQGNKKTSFILSYQLNGLSGVFVD